MKIRTAIFVVYVAVSAAGLALLMGLVLRDVRRRYIESMRRTMGDTAVLLAALATEGSRDGGAWTQKLETLPANAEWLRVFANDPADRVLFDSAGGRDVGRVYPWPMRGGGRSASENYSLPNVAEVGGELRVRAPVRRGGELVGWVGVGRPLAAVTVGVSEARWRLAMYSGVIAAVLIVFIPTVGDYVTPDLIGGGKLPMIANMIEVTMLKQNDRHLGSAIAMTAMLIVAIVSLVFLLLNRRFLKGSK